MRSLKNKLKFLIMALLAIVFLSAFTFDEKETISRYELAGFISEIVLQALPDASQVEQKAIYKDLSAKQLNSIEAALHHRIICGYADQTFRPEVTVSNQELLWYLYRTWDFLRLNAPDSSVAKKLSRLVGFEKHQFYSNLKSSFSLFKQNVLGYEPAETYLLKRLKNAFKTKGSWQKLEISLVDAVDSSPIFPGFVVVEQKAGASDNKGKLVFEFEKMPAGHYEVFASAEGYHSIKLRRDMMQAASLTLKLRPVVGQLDLKVQAKTGHKKTLVKDFKVLLNNTEQIIGKNGFLRLKRLKHGYHELQISAKGHATVNRRIYSQAGTLELEIDLPVI